MMHLKRCIYSANYVALSDHEPWCIFTVKHVA